MATKRVLIIDDDLGVRAIVCTCLEAVGWEVVVAESGPKGLVKVIAAAPDAVLLDVVMPEMSGLEVLTVLRNYIQEFTLPVVLLTVRTDLIESGELIGLDVKGVIAKPFDPSQLAQQVAQLLDWNVSRPPS